MWSARMRDLSLVYIDAEIEFDMRLMKAEVHYSEAINAAFSRGNDLILLLVACGGFYFAFYYDAIATFFFCAVKTFVRGLHQFEN